MTETTPDAGRLVTEALVKSGLLWVTSDAGSAPCWHATVNGVAYVVSGPGEQFSPAHVGRVEVVTRSKETRARLASFIAEAQQITPENDDWEVATFGLKAGRLNAPAEDVVARWATECRITRLIPDLSTVVLRGRALPAPGVDGDAPADDTATPTGDTSTSASSAAPAEASLGTQAPGGERSAAAAAEREHRAAVRADAEATPTGDAATRVGP